MTDLNRRPPKLKNNDRNGEINDLHCQGRILAAQTGMPEEEQRCRHHHGSNEMPQLSPPVPNMGIVAQEANDGRSSRISNLTNEDE